MEAERQMTDIHRSVRAVSRRADSLRADFRRADYRRADYKRADYKRADTRRAAVRRAVCRRAGAVAVAAAVAGAGVAMGGCAVTHAVGAAVDAIRGNKATMDAFTAKLSSGPSTFEVTYVTPGSAPVRVVYAVHPPVGLDFEETPSTTSSGAAPVHLVVDRTGEYSCAPGSAPHVAPTCTMLPKASAADTADILGFYTPSHWVSFLRGFSLAAGFAGDRVTTSDMTVNGFAMSCVDFTPPGVARSTVCTTKQHVLGYVKVAGSPTSFEITGFSTSVAPALLALPPGATVTTLPPITTTTTAP
jgi:hypothetical protein